MRTFKGTATLTFKVVATDEFLASMREAAEAQDASPFLKMTQERHPVNDDAFISAILANGIRQGIKLDLARRFDTSVGLGGTVSPASITITEAIPDHDAPAAVPQVVEVPARSRDNDTGREENERWLSVADNQAAYKAQHPHLNIEGQG